MKHHVILFWSLLVTTTKLLKPGGAREIVAENSQRLLSSSYGSTLNIQYNIFNLSMPLTMATSIVNNQRLELKFDTR